MYFNLATRFKHLEYQKKRIVVFILFSNTFCFSVESKYNGLQMNKIQKKLIFNVIHE